MLRTPDLFAPGGVRNLVDVAIERIRMFEPPEGYWLAYSGGKDSDVILELAKMAGVRHEAHYNLTTVDPPELVRYIMDVHPKVIIDKPKESMWRLIVRKGSPPYRNSRYCCSEDD
jgi:phosphoadenosine phosphosulfate reductase